MPLSYCELDIANTVILVKVNNNWKESESEKCSVGVVFVKDDEMRVKVLLKWEEESAIEIKIKKFRLGAEEK